MIHLYDTTAIEEKALTYLVSKNPVDQVETPDQAFQRLVKQTLRGIVQIARAAQDEKRAAAYDAATPTVKASVDAALNVS